MFERLVGKLMNKLLSKYFVQKEEKKNISVWSGYISFENLELKPDVVNELLESKGIELVSGSIQSLEITIPWSKLGSGSAASSYNPDDDDSAVVICVLDGVHLLFKTNPEYNDESLRQSAIRSRQADLRISEAFGRNASFSISKLLQQRIKEGLWKDIMEKLHVHIRNVHVRMEDDTTDPSNPYACGVTLESLHIQAQEESSDELRPEQGMVRKEGQLNHFAVYWNAVSPEHDMPVESSILHRQDLSARAVAKALNKCISRRASPLATLGRPTEHIAKHSYLLSPVDATCQVALSTEPDKLKERPSVMASIVMDDLSVHLRDFQCAGIQCLLGFLKEYKFFKRYRPYRPQKPVKDDPKAWWHYAARLVRMELRESRMRWSWSRFHQRYELRRRYCLLYERLCRYPLNATAPILTEPNSTIQTSLEQQTNGHTAGIIHSPSLQALSAVLETPLDQGISPDEGAGPSTDTSTQSLSAFSLFQGPLSLAEQAELKELEDGLRGDLSVRDIVLFRAIVNARLAGIVGSTSNAKKRSGFRSWMRSVASEDAESEREYERLIGYLDSASECTAVTCDDETKGLIAVSVRAELGRGCISLYSPLTSTTDQRQHRRLHQKFADITIKSLCAEVDLMGNFESYELSISLDDFVTTERRSDGKEYIVVSRVQSVNDATPDGGDALTNSLIYLQMTSNPPDHPEYDIGFHTTVDNVEIIVNPECEWIHKIRDLAPRNNGKISSKSFWQDVAIAQFNSIAADRAGWIARATRSLGEHKNLDLDVRINCPVIQICGDRNSSLRVDLGMAHLVTESLAGVAIGKLNYAYGEGRQSERSINTSKSVEPHSAARSNQVTSTTDPSDVSVGSLPNTPGLESQTMMTFPSSPRSKIGMDNFFLESSSSLIGSEAKGFAGKTSSSGFRNPQRSGNQSVHSSFYDKFHISLSEINIHLLDQVQGRDDSILSNVALNVSLESSVIPSDHSLCRFKTKTIVEDFVFALSLSNGSDIAIIFNAWKQAFDRSPRQSSPILPRGVDRSSLLHHELMTEIESRGIVIDDTASDDSSFIDVNEFLDVFEDDNDAWSEDNWDADAESTINGDDPSIKSVKKKRRARSISDVSSISDGSQKRSRAKNTSAVYLNAENLARLEEGGGEEDDDSELDSDEDSFHSAISFGGRLELANTLLEDIESVEKEVTSLQKNFQALSKGMQTGHVLTSSEAKQRRQERQSLKMTLDRAQAELRALKASHHDLEQSVDINLNDEKEEGFVDVSKKFEADERSQSQDHAALRAQTILRYRRKKSSSVAVEGENQDTSGAAVQRELFQANLLIRRLSFTLDNDTQIEQLPSVTLRLSQVTVVASHRQRDSRLLFGVDMLSISRKDAGKHQDLVRAGGPTISTLMSRVTSAENDRFLRMTLEVGHGRPGVGTKCRIFFGGIEVSPDASLFSTVSEIQAVKSRSSPPTSAVSERDKDKLFHQLNKALVFLKDTNIRQTRFYDLSIRFSSLRLGLLVDDTPPSGMIVLSDTGIRISLEHGSQTARLQLDTMLGNLQVFDVGADGFHQAKELLSRRDHYGQLARSRIRISCSPLSKHDDWAAGCVKQISGGELPLGSEDMVVDCHLGFRVQPIQIIAHADSLKRLLRLRKAPSTETRAPDYGESAPLTKTQAAHDDELPLETSPIQIPIRWRVDLDVQRITVILPSVAGDRGDMPKIPDSALQMLLSFRVCANHDNPTRLSGPIIQAALYDISLVRSLDDWPILERTMISLEAILKSSFFDRIVCPQLGRMELPVESFWSESPAGLRDCFSTNMKPGPVPHDKLEPHEATFRVSLTGAPVRVNVTSSILALLKRMMNCYKSVNKYERIELSDSKRNSWSFHGEAYLALTIPEVEVKFFKDVTSATRGGIAHARSLFSVSCIGCLVNASWKSDGAKAYIKVGDFMVHDLTAAPGVRAVGLSYSTDNGPSNSFLSLAIEFHSKAALPILDVRLRWGKIQLLVLPSLLESLLSTLRSIPKSEVAQANASSDASGEAPLPLPSFLLSLSLETDGFECILSTKNVFEHIREGSGDAIHVVTFRWKSSLYGSVTWLSSSDIPNSAFSADVYQTDNLLVHDQVKIAETLRRFAENQLHTMELLNSVQNAQRTVCSIHLDLDVSDFQALRTSVIRVRTSLSPAGDSGDMPAVFAIFPPEAGEQRITNPINFSAKYRLFGTSVSIDGLGNLIDNMELSQAFDLETDMVDVLVYIRQSAGGMHDAYHVTLKPIFSMIKDTPRKPQRLKKSGSSKDLGKKIEGLVKRATTIGSATVKGCQVTLVPGGATRLTESPIIQFVLNNAKVGVAAIDAPINLQDSLGPKETTLLGISTSPMKRAPNVYAKAYPVQPTVSHSTVAGWLSVDVSAHYHNRRLVAWEPLIEEWTAHANFGVDLVKVLRIPPVVRIGNTSIATDSNDASTPVAVVPEGSERLRDIRRLFGSPFLPKQVQVDNGSSVQTPSDMPYLLLVSTEQLMISSALYPGYPGTLNVQEGSFQRHLTRIPGLRRLEWLQLFGHPGITGDVKSPFSDPAIQCSFTDSRLLNVNLTGALIENLSTYLCGSSTTNAIIPHWIRNDTGLTIRYLEVLDSGRVSRSDRLQPTTLASGREIPLSLKRVGSQSCDPHRAYITLELGSFEETVDRVDHSKYNVSKGSFSTTFFYKAVGRIPVDTVGIHELSFYENTELLSDNVPKTTEAVGKIIVRISLKGGIKLVSIESPMMICNASDQDLCCEIRDINGISLLWSSSVSIIKDREDEAHMQRLTVPIPADLVLSIDSSSSTLALSAPCQGTDLQLARQSGTNGSKVDPPRPYSNRSITRGIIAEKEVSIIPSTSAAAQLNGKAMYEDFVHLSACSLRLGSADTASFSRSRTALKKPDVSIIPQQRMLLLRPPLVIANHLPLLMHVRIRRKNHSPSRAIGSSSNLAGFSHADLSTVGANGAKEKQLQREDPWTDLGVVACGKSVCWTGAQNSQTVEMKVKLMDVRDKNTEKFPNWSTAATILPDTESNGSRGSDMESAKMIVLDASGIALTLSLHVDVGLVSPEKDVANIEDVRSFSTLVDRAPRVVSVNVPYWIVDSSASELEFLSNKPIAGQSCCWSYRKNGTFSASSEQSNSLSSLGLAEMLDIDRLDHSANNLSFEILMIGDDRATRLTMRQRRERIRRDIERLSQHSPPWCEPIALLSTENTFTDIDIFPPSATRADDLSDRSERLALRSEIVKAPLKCGGKNRTRIVHIVNRYRIVNQMGRDLEVMAGHGRGEPITIMASSNSIPFHFDDSRMIRFRPTEFGWLWSGKISVSKKRREVSVRLVHKLRGQIIIASLECISNSKSPSTILVFRNAAQPPFRLENHTMYAFRYGQSSHFVPDEENKNWQRNDLSLDTTLLPYQHANFAWDEPEEGRRAISIELGDTAHRGLSSSNGESRILGTFAIEKIAPGSALRLSIRDFAGQIVADGPTRVLRITDSNFPSSIGTVVSGDVSSSAFSKKEGALNVPSWIELKLLHGIGISVVDWTPQELLYISIDDVVIARSVDDTNERVSIAIGHLSVDNQLWVTPYPVLLKVGRKQGRRRRNQALQVGWTRELAKQGGLMLLSNLEVSVDPITIKVDGTVVNELLNMILHPLEESRYRGTPQSKHWLESEISKVLRLEEAPSPKRRTSVNSVLMPGIEEEFMATAAVAAKIYAGSQSRSVAPPTRAELPRHKDQRKFYINKLKISKVKTEISWTGALPTAFVGLPTLLRPALTFESLPVSLRSFTSYHAYGTFEDIAEDLKQHYVSVWRLFDVLFGLTFKPTFLIRACVYTSREFVASVLDTMAQWCTNAEDALLTYIPRDMVLTSGSTSNRRQGLESVSKLYRAIVGKPTLLMASSYRTWAMLTSSMALSLRYREPNGAFTVRTRNPRLFAHVDGKDLLVKYVEGENAGKALLSRVRAGQHLVEGYIFHTEKVQTSESVPLIIMVTSERVLLLNGERKANFCHVIWEVLFENMVHIELDTSSDGAFFHLAKFWYLVDTEQSKGNTEDRMTRFAHVIVGDSDLGLGMLLCKSLFIPHESMATFRRKVSAVYNRLD